MPVDEEAHFRRYADAIHAARAAGTDTFQSWFNTSESIEESLRRGYWDFALHILTPGVARRIADPGSLTALEIGYGGGRLLNEEQADAAQQARDPEDGARHPRRGQVLREP